MPNDERIAKAVYAAVDELNEQLPAGVHVDKTLDAPLYDQNQDWRGRGSYDSYPNWGGWEFRQTALNAGYNEGLKQGRHDRNRRWGGRGDFGNSSYRNADKDYNPRFGDRELYHRYFQMAFETGYRDGLNGY